MGALIEFRDVCKFYQMGDTTVKAANHIELINMFKGMGYKL